MRGSVTNIKTLFTQKRGKNLVYFRTFSSEDEVYEKAADERRMKQIEMEKENACQCGKKERKSVALAIF